MTRDAFLKKIKNSDIVLFGAGECARKFWKDYHDEYRIVYCVSNYPEEHTLVVDGREELPVYRADERVPETQAYIVVCTTQTEPIGEQLEALGKIAGDDYIDYEFARAVFSEKKIAVCYGVCYLRSIHDCLRLSTAFMRDYYVFYRLSYLKMYARDEAMFSFLLNMCDLYIHISAITPAEKRKANRFMDMLPKECRKISIPLITTTAYHPQAVGGFEDNPYSVTSASTSWATFMNADCNINRLLEEGKKAEEIVSIISDESYYSRDYLEKHYEEEMSILAMTERMADIRITDFISENRGKLRLFLNHNHISNVVIAELAGRLLTMLGYDNRLPMDEILGKRLLYTTEVPIYPSVIKGLELTAYQETEPKYQLFTFQGDMEVTFAEYVEAYCDFCGQMKRYMEIGYFPR